ncbi:MAG: phosphotransferase [Chloroflexaceae bacterium]|jgi:aminoglycoside phosphotransferase (APT) family kinase protein|nr:phosphotransferase [Chloroflexaceae bacterium]
MNLEHAAVEHYLREQFGAKVTLLDLRALADPESPSQPGTSPKRLKIFGYGHPVLVRYQVAGEERRAVLRTMAEGAFGHEYRADRAASLIQSFDSFNRLPQHVQALDIGTFTDDGDLHSLGVGKEYFLLTEYAPGSPYANDLLRLRDGGSLTERDLHRAEELARYLGHMHAFHCNDQLLYQRHLRDVFGSGEGIAGLLDSYPADDPIADLNWLIGIEEQLVAWRWRLKRSQRRPAQLHGDFHPYNVLWMGDQFTLLDRSRSPWGEAADDVSCMAINYLFFSVQAFGSLAPPFTTLWERFWQTYLDTTHDDGILRVVQPFFAWRGLVLASPVWYHVTSTVRETMCHVVENILHDRVFDPGQVNRYLR